MPNYADRLHPSPLSSTPHPEKKTSTNSLDLPLSSEHAHLHYAHVIFMETQIKRERRMVATNNN